MKKTIKDKITKTLIEILIKILGKDKTAYILGIDLRRKRVFSNDGYSKHSCVVASCHPLNSITWHWAVYWTKYSKDRTTVRSYIKNGFGFHFSKQKLIIINK